MRTALTELFGIEAPLVGFNRSPAVVVAVSRAGGLGVLGGTGYTPEQLDAQLTWIEEQLDGLPYGVDLLVPGGGSASAPGEPSEVDRAALLERLRAQIPDGHRRFVDELLVRYQIPALGRRSGSDRWALNLGPTGVSDLLDVAFEHPIAMIANALGTPPTAMVEQGKAAGVPVAALVGKPEHAVRQLEAGVDLLIAQGTEAGGHTGTIATMVLTPEVVDLAGEVPVLAAGGIANGRQMAAALALGAAGVWCGSVWLASHEDVAPLEVKRKFLAATSSDTVRTKTRTGKPARQLRSAWTDAWEAPGSPEPLPMPLQPMLVAEAWHRIDAASADGNPGARELESFFIGQVVGGFRELRPAEEITREIIADCAVRLAELGRLAGS